ncbi:MAG: hypothetical protein GY715_00390 [Planctomycetes bacterium]|nr:hypothetical protein [Planctomycetota bacterium]
MHTLYARNAPHSFVRTLVTAAVAIATMVPFAKAGEVPAVRAVLSDGSSHAYVEPARQGPPYIETYGGAGDGPGPTFTVEYLDVTNDTDFGFDDPALGSVRRDTVQAMLAYVSTILDHTGSADLEFQLSQSDGTGALASAGPFFFDAPGTCVDPFTLIHITTGTDPFGSVPDARVTVDFGYTWNSDTGAPMTGESDLFSVLLHEVTHALGFISSLRSSCAPSCCVPAPGVDTRYVGYDAILVQGSTSANLVNCSNGEYVGGDLVGGAGGVLMNGTAINAAWAALGLTGSPPMHTPDPFSCGASVGHWGRPSDHPDMPDAVVMQPSLTIGSERRTYHPLDIAALDDIGYAVVVGPSCSEDLDGSGDVGFGDILTIIGAWGPCGGCPEDLSGNGAVDFADILLVIGAWGPC